MFAMRFNLALISSFLLASAVLAGRRHEPRRSRFHNHAENFTRADGATSSPNWAGAVWRQGDGTFHTVTGTFTVPEVSGQSGTGAAAWVGIDGDTCHDVILQAGVTFSVTPSGSVYQPWYQWFPDPPGYFKDINISPGDIIKLVVSAPLEATAGFVLVENLSNNQSIIKLLQSSHALCGQNAEWVVEDFMENGSLIPFADFHSVAFTNAVASGNGGQTYGPFGATLYDIEENGQVVTSVAVGDEAVTIYYV